MIDACLLITEEPSLDPPVYSSRDIASQFDAQERSDLDSELVEGNCRRLFFPLAVFRR